MLAEADQERFDRLRFVEIKHGRIAMLAVLGQIVTKAGIRLPGDIDMSGTHFSDIGTGWSALGQVRGSTGSSPPPPPPRAPVLPPTTHARTADHTRTNARPPPAQFSPYGTYQMVAFVGCLELFVMKDIEGTGNEFPGDFRNGALDFGWDELSEEDKLSKRAIELNNGQRRAPRARTMHHVEPRTRSPMRSSPL